jgi:hypothetical protein
MKLTVPIPYANTWIPGPKGEHPTRLVLDIQASYAAYYSDEKRSLNRIACQLSGMLAEARPDLMKRAGRSYAVIAAIVSTTVTCLRASNQTHSGSARASTGSILHTQYQLL